MTKVKLPKDSPNSIMMFPEAKFLTKDYTNSKKHRYSRKNGGQKYSPLSIGQPSHILHIANLPAKSDINKLKDFLGAHKITQIEIIGKQRTCQAFVRCLSVDLACQILIDKHSQMFYGREIKISFATRSHMPSDLVKKHGGYHRSHSNSPTTIQTLTINHPNPTPTPTTPTLTTPTPNPTTPTPTPPSPTPNSTPNPTPKPTYIPTRSTSNPTISTSNPTSNPTKKPTNNPSSSPTQKPTANPTKKTNNRTNTKTNNRTISKTNNWTKSKTNI